MTTTKISHDITIVATEVGIKRWYARCAAHPDWKPCSGYDRSKAIGDAETHTYQVHDGINYDDMPPALVSALREIRDPALRRRVARGARQWSGRRS